MNDILKKTLGEMKSVFSSNEFSKKAKIGTQTKMYNKNPYKCVVFWLWIIVYGGLLTAVIIGAFQFY